MPKPEITKSTEQQPLPDPRFKSWKEVGEYSGAHMSGWYWKHSGKSVFDKEFLDSYFEDKEKYLNEVKSIGALLMYAEPVYAEESNITLSGTGGGMKFTTCLKEDDLVELGFSKHTMPGTGWISISSMRDAIYYYKNGRISINATTFWTWFLDGEMRNDIAVSNKEAMKELLTKYNNTVW